MANFITCVKSKSVDFKKNYIGQNVNNFNVITTQLEVFFANNANNNTLQEWFSQISTWQATGDFLPTLVVHGLTFTNCRITNVDFSTSDGGMNSAIKRGSVIITIEERYAGDLSNLDADNYAALGTLLAGNIHAIKDITEDLSYNVGVNGQFSLAHSVTVTLVDGNDGTLAKTYGLQVAGAILDSYLPSNTAGYYTSVHSALLAAGEGGLLSTTINQITGEATYSRKIDLLATVQAGSDTSSEYSHSLSLGKDGIVTVSESGKIIPTSVGKYTQAVANLPAILAAAGGRCTAIFTDYTAKLDNSVTVAIQPLFVTATDISRGFNAIAQEVSYNISFSNNPALQNGHTIDRSTDINKDNGGTVVLAEKTSFVQHGAKCVSDPISLYATDNAGAFGRIMAIYGDFNAGNAIDGGAAFTFKLISRNVSYSPDGKNLSYSISYSSDYSISASGSNAANAGIIKQTIDVSDKLPERMRQEFPVASFGMVVHDPGQTSLGSRSVSITANLERSTAYTLGNPGAPTAAMTYMADIARTHLLNVFADLGFANHHIFVSECTYNFNSKRNVNLNVTAQYLQAR